MLTIVLFALLLLLILASVPIAVAMLASSWFVILVFTDIPPTVVGQKMFDQIASFPLVAILLYVFVAEVMVRSDMANDLVDLIGVLMRRVRGGLAVTAVFAAMLFGGISGSAAADTGAIGGTLLPPMKRYRYDIDFCSALIAAAGSVGPIVPPSIPMIIYGTLATGVSISALFAGGIVPGVLLSLGFATYAFFKAKQLPVEAGEFFEARNWKVTAVRGFMALLLPVVILGVLFGGIASATEAGAIGAAYALVYGVTFRRIRDLGVIREIAVRSLKVTGLIGFIISAAAPFAWIMAEQQIPNRAASFIIAVSGGQPFIGMVLVCLALLVLGTIVEATAGIILVAPVLAQIAASLHVDAVYMGVIGVFTLMIGLFTPPVGTNLFVVGAISGRSLEHIVRHIAPFVLIAIVILILLLAFPELVVWSSHLV